MRARIITALPCTVFLLACSPVSAQRLPSSVAPAHYDLAFDVDLAGARFAGTETIKVLLSEPSRRIVLHALELQFQEVTVTAGGVEQKAVVALDAPTQTAILTVPRPVAAGPADIHARYTGTLNDKLRGFYLSKENGRSYAITQFESTDARRAFPSFDEPVFKATFSVSLTIDAADTAIANGRLVSDIPGPGAGRHTLSFVETPKMSSYLVAMAVGDFQCLEGAADTVPIRICATPAKKELGHIALDAAQQILTFYNQYFSIKYPFHKLDVVVVPDFAAGGMENTAAIFSRESAMLADEETASVNTVQGIWSVLAHEIAHQWFGDLVTPRWWDDLWLNEGFATWMENRPAAILKPEWKIEVEEVVDTQRAMNLDSLASTRAIRLPVETPDEIEGSFDAIVYDKGGAVMRMIEGYLGAETFRKGVNAYLEQHAYGNAASEDFWTAMAAVSGKPIDRILPTFVSRPGLPLISAALRCDGRHTQLTLTEQRFFTDAAMTKTATGTPDWHVPICITTPDSETPACQVISGSQPTVTLDGARCSPWAFVNAGAHGYIRTEYPPAMLAALAPDVSTRLTEPERLMLVGDEWALVSTGRHNVGDYLTLASALDRERSNGVLSEVARRLRFMQSYLTTGRSRPVFQRFVGTLLGPAFAELGISGKLTDDDDRRALRATVIGTLGDLGNDPALAAAARTAVDKAFSGGTPLDTSAADAIVGVAARNGDAALWVRMLNASKDAKTPGERYRYLYSLAAFENPALIDRGLNLVVSPELRNQDTWPFLVRFMSNPVARARAWTFVKQHWAEVAPKIKISFGEPRFVASLGAFCDTASRDDVKNFFTEHKLPAASRALDQTLERIDNCIATRAKQAPALESWLQKQ